MVAMPGPRIEVVERVIQHLVELSEHFDDLVIGIAMICVNVVAGAVPARSPDDWNLVQAEEVARRLDVCPVLQLEGNMVHLRSLAAHEVHGVMVWAAAQEHKP